MYRRGIAKIFICHGEQILFYVEECVMKSTKAKTVNEYLLY